MGSVGLGEALNIRSQSSGCQEAMDAFSSGSGLIDRI